MRVASTSRPEERVLLSSSLKELCLSQVFSSPTKMPLRISSSSFNKNRLKRLRNRGHRTVYVEGWRAITPTAISYVAFHPNEHLSNIPWWEICCRRISRAGSLQLLRLRSSICINSFLPGGGIVTICPLRLWFCNRSSSRA